MIPVLHPTEDKKKEQIVNDFMDTDEWRHYFDDDQLRNLTCYVEGVDVTVSYHIHVMY